VYWLDTPDPDFPEGDAFYVYATIDDGNTMNYSMNYTSIIIVDHPDPGDDLSYYVSSWTEGHEGDGDGIPEAGEDIELVVQLTNRASVAIDRVEALLTTADSPFVFIDDGITDYDTIGAGDSSEGNDEYHIALNFHYTRSCSFNLHVDYRKNGSWYYDDHPPIDKTFYKDGVKGPKFEVREPNPTVIDDSRTDRHGDNDRILESGENANFDLYLKNVGTADAVEVEAKVTDVKGNGTTFDVGKTIQTSAQGGQPKSRMAMTSRTSKFLPILQGT